MKEYTVNEAREILTKYLGNDRLDCLRISKCEQCAFNGDACTANFFDNKHLAKAEAEIEKREERVDWSKVAIDTKVLVRDDESNDIVFDPCMGSGSAGLVAIENNRNFIGIELDEKYFKIAEERLKEQKCRQ